jgi:hypothetical protein
LLAFFDFLPADFSDFFLSADFFLPVDFFLPKDFLPFPLDAFLTFLLLLLEFSDWEAAGLLFT